MVHIICQNVDKHAVKMMEELHQMKREHDHCDFIIQVGADVYYTHKNVLSAGSAYFKAMLMHDTKERREGRVNFKDVDSECVKNCIDFIYSGKFEIDDEKLNDLLYVAIMLQLDDVKQAVSDIFEKSINVENYFSTRNVSDMYGLDDVSTQCRIFLHENIMEISKQPQFGNIDKNDILNFVKSKKLKLCEENKLELSLAWVESNQKNKEDLHKCLEAIKFDKVSMAFLEHILGTNPIISNDFGLYKIINGHFLEASKRSIKSEETGNKDSIILFDNNMDCIRSFNPITEKVEKFHDEGFKHLKLFGMISLDSFIYVLCQNKSVHRLNCQNKTSKWEKMKDMISEHGDDPRSVLFMGSIFVIGGSCFTVTSSVETFHSAANQWFQLQNKPTAICDASLVSLNDSIYCIGGWRDGYAVSSFCRFIPSSSEWVDLQPMRYPVWGSGVVAVDQRIFAIGGWSGKDTIKSVECYDVTSAQWTSLSSTNFYHGCNAVHRIDNGIFAVTDGGTSNVIEKYEIAKDKWIMVNPKVDKCFKIYKSTSLKI